MTLYIGQQIELGWNGAKQLGGAPAYETVRVEAIGFDWIIVRDLHGSAWAATFERGATHDVVLRELQA